MLSRLDFPTPWEQYHDYQLSLPQKSFGKKREKKKTERNTLISSWRLTCITGLSAPTPTGMMGSGFCYKWKIHIEFGLTINSQREVSSSVSGNLLTQSFHARYTCQSRTYLAKDAYGSLNPPKVVASTTRPRSSKLFVSSMLLSRWTASPNKNHENCNTRW